MADHEEPLAPPTEIDKELDEIYSPHPPTFDYSRSRLRLLLEDPAGHAAIDIKPDTKIAAPQNLPGSPKSPKSIG
jgi:hypothetical protein